MERLTDLLVAAKGHWTEYDPRGNLVDAAGQRREGMCHRLSRLGLVGSSVDVELVPAQPLANYMMFRGGVELRDGE